MPLKANVGLSRKLSKDYNSTGFSLNLEGEILASLDDPEAVIGRIQQLYAIAEEALDRQVSESQGVDALARRDAVADHPPDGNGQAERRSAPPSESPAPSQDGRPRNGEPATNKQLQFLQTLARRGKLNGPRLEGFIAEVVGRRCSAYDLTKKEAAKVIDRLSGGGQADPSRN